MAKKAIQDRILPEAPAPVRSAPKPKASAPVKDRGAGAFYSPGDYSRRKGDLLGLRDVQKEFGPRSRSTKAKPYKMGKEAFGPPNAFDALGGYGIVGASNLRAFPTAKAPKATVSGIYSDVNARMMAHNKKLAAEAAAKKQAAAPKKAAPIRTTVDMRVTPTGAKAKSSRPLTASEARSLAPGNYRSGKVTMGGKTYTGFTVGSRTDSKGRTTKSVGNWTSTKDAGRSANSKGSFGMGAPKGSLFGGGSKSSGSKSSSSKSSSSRSSGGRSLSGKP